MKNKKNGFEKYLPAQFLYVNFFMFILLISNHTVLSHFNFVHLEKRGRHAPMNSSSCMLLKLPAFIPPFTHGKCWTSSWQNLYFSWPDWTVSSGVFRSSCVSFISCLLCWCPLCTWLHFCDLLLICDDYRTRPLTWFAAEMCNEVLYCLSYLSHLPTV